MPERAPARILVVDDEWLIATTLREIVHGLGHEVIGPAPTVRRALALIAERMPDAALLDIALGSDRSFALATHLHERGVPFAFLTGYETADLPGVLANRPVLGKPVTAADLGNLLARLLAPARAPRSRRPGG